MRTLTAGLSILVMVSIFIMTGCKTITKNSDDSTAGDQKKNVSAAGEPVSKRPDDKGAAKKNENDTNTPSFSGVYTIIIQGYKGKLVLEIKRGGNTGTIFYNDWGKGLPIPISNLSINGNKIYFERAVETKEDLIKYGGNRYFKQQYFGEFRENGKRIKGYFRDSGAESNWEAVKN